MIAEAQTPSSMAEAAAIKERDDKVSSGKADLLGTIVRAGKSDNNMALNEAETIGNIFIFIMAGHETTAIALQAALLLLATHPNIQQNVQDEIDAIWASKEPGEDFSYGDYPKMRTIMAVMLETLRLFPAVGLIPKITSGPQTLKMGDNEIHVPPSTTVSIDVIGLHRNPKYWGPDTHDFRPSRWLMTSGYTQPKDTINESTAHADLLCPVKGSYMAFSGGFRACLGKKFAQVEFCCLVAVLLKNHSIELVKENGRSWEETRRKAEVDMDARRSGLAMRMQKKIKVRFVKRGTESFPPRS
jgi:cytochrome P450